MIAGPGQKTNAVRALARVESSAQRPIMSGDGAIPSFCESLIMRERKYLFPHVIEMNYQAGRRLGVNVYLIDGGSEFALIDVGYLDTVDEIVELIRQMDFNLSQCRMLIATHADADHI